MMPGVGRLELLLFGGMLLVLLITVGIAALVLLLRSLRSEHEPDEPQQPPVCEILDQRLAREEIDEEEHTQLRTRMGLSKELSHDRVWESSCR
jgi:uncharacterized membrane protein